MNDYLKKILAIDLGFPGIEIGCEQSAIDIFIENISDYVAYASDQYSLRAKHIIESKHKLFEPSEYGQEIMDIEDRANNDLPQFYYRQACVMLWAHFEWSIKRLIKYSLSKDSSLPPFCSKEHNLHAETFCKCVKKYFKKSLGGTDILTQEQWSLLDNFNIIRSNVAHSNGALEGIDENKRLKLNNAILAFDGISIVRNYLVLSENCVKQWHKLTIIAIKSFANFYARKYPGAEAFLAN